MSATASFTPGPWVASGEVRAIPSAKSGAYDLWCGEILPAQATRHRGSVAIIQSAAHINGISREEAEANAKLLAASPELVAALLTALPYVERVAATQPTQYHNIERQRAAAKDAAMIRAVLTKATTPQAHTNEAA
ncbi:hypothetical protein ACSVBT_06910 [Afipia sp. TerB]